MFSDLHLYELTLNILIILFLHTQYITTVNKNIIFFIYFFFCFFIFLFSHLKKETFPQKKSSFKSLHFTTQNRERNLFHEMRTHLLKLILTVSLPTTFFIGISIVVIFILCRRRRRTTTESSDLQNDVESPYEKQDFSGSETEEEEEELVIFEGGEDLTICDILEAPGEVIGKSSYGTLYKASLQRSGKVRVLRFLRPLCAARSDPEEFDGVIEALGFVRHDNLVPLFGFYVGNRGEKLMIHPFFGSGNLSEFIRCKSLCFFSKRKKIKDINFLIFSKKSKKLF